MNRAFNCILFFLLSGLFFTKKTSAQDPYFQQKVNYKIEVKLDDKKHELSAYEEITYKNNSPVTLNHLYFHLWPNAYKNTQTALAKQLLENGETKMYYADEEDLGFIDSLDFKVNKETIKWELDSKNIDICKLFLIEPLKPGDSIVISTPFHVKLPSAEISRLGHIGQAYMITQWYPKPAVYDINSWNAMPYLNQGEFYSEFGSFDVSITLPKNYLLAATGDRIDGNTEEDKFIEDKFEETKSKIERYTRGGDIAFLEDMSFPASDIENKTLRFKQYNVHDFAWFADKRFNVLQGEVELPKSQRTVKTWAFFTNKNLPLWKDAREYLNDATFFYSLWNGDYQYNNVTAIDGTISAGGGMEYPNITVIGDSRNAFELETVIMHEVGHNWFYGMLGSNERLHGWMDEGINSFNELRYIKTKYPSATLGAMFGQDSTFTLGGLHKFKQAQQYELLYKYSALQNIDQRCELHSAKYTELNYGAIVYSKTAVLFNYLMNYMGEDEFDRAMQFYFNNFKFKHPQPKDLRRTLEYFSAKDLSWFFDDLIGTTKKLDYKVTRAKKNKDGQFEITVKNTGEINGPVAICGLYKGEIRAMMWLDGFEGKRTVTCPPAEVDEFRIDYFQFMPDMNRKNNSCRTNGLFKKVEPIRFPFFAALDDPYQSQLFWTPLVGYNNYNGFMAGLALYNHAALQKTLEYELLPIYGFQNKNIAGYGNVQLNFRPHSRFQQISVGVKGARFAYLNEPFSLNYNKIAPFINFIFKKKNLRSPISQNLTYRAVMLSNESFEYYLTKSGDYEPSRTWSNYLVNDITYKLDNKRAINPFSVAANYQSARGMDKVSLTANYYVTLKNRKAFQFRFFGGKMFSNSSGHFDARFRMSGQSGFQDYLFDNVYVGRNEYYAPNIAVQQFTETDGAFKTGSYAGQSDDWIVAFNVKTPKIFMLPLFVYADAGAYHANGMSKSADFLWDLGIGVPVVKDFMEVFFPVVNSQNMTDAQNPTATRYIDKVRFTFYLNRANPFEVIKNNLPF
ncbi:MAG TPA: M1 family metallopeptidase [Bacteroidia bacterium]